MLQGPDFGAVLLNLLQLAGDPAGGLVSYVAVQRVYYSWNLTYPDKGLSGERHTRYITPRLDHSDDKLNKIEGGSFCPTCWSHRASKGVASNGGSAANTPCPGVLIRPSYMAV